jgi:hypothetical protein
MSDRACPHVRVQRRKFDCHDLPIFPGATGGGGEICWRRGGFGQDAD